MSGTYYMPTKVLMGENSIIENSAVFKEFGQKALIVTGRNSAKINGSQDDVITALIEQNIAYAVFDKVMANPTVDCVYDGAAFAISEAVDFIIAIGGGSPIDAAKAIALLACQDIKEEELFSGNYANEVLPLIAVPTTAGTGSEVTQYSIITNDRAKTKSGIASTLIFPKIAFLDAKYMMTLSPEITVNTAIDALSHAVEGMLSKRSTSVSDALAEKSIAMIMASVSMMQAALSSGASSDIDIKLREELLYASFLAGMVIAQTGTIAVHAMGYSLTYFKHIDHGRANGLLLAEYLKYVGQKDAELEKSVLTAMGLSSSDELKDIMDKLFGKKEDISQDEIELFSEKTMQTKNIPNSSVAPAKQDVVKIFTSSFM